MCGRIIAAPDEDKLLPVSGVDAVDMCREAIAAAPENPGAWALLADLHTVRQEWSDAANAYRQSIVLNKDDQPAVDRDLSHLAISLSFVGDHNSVHEAVAIMEDLLHRYPTNVFCSLH